MMFDKRAAESTSVQQSGVLHESTPRKPSRTSRAISAYSSSVTGGKALTLRFKLKLCHSHLQCFRYSAASSNSVLQAEQRRAFFFGCSSGASFFWTCGVNLASSARGGGSNFEESDADTAVGGLTTLASSAVCPPSPLCICGAAKPEDVDPPIVSPSATTAFVTT